MERMVRSFRAGQPSDRRDAKGEFLRGSRWVCVMETSGTGFGPYPHLLLACTKIWMVRLRTP